LAPKRKPDRIISVGRHASGNFRVRYCLDGKQRDEYRKTELAANKRADVIAAQIEAAASKSASKDVSPAAPPNSPPPTGTRARIKEGDWLGALWHLAEQIIDDPSDEAPQRAMKAISSGAMAAGRFIDDTKLREEHEKLRGIVREILSARKDGTRSSGRNAPVDKNAQPVQPLN
jgi:hypothetical protein